MTDLRFDRLAIAGVAFLVGVSLSLTANTARSDEICSKANLDFFKKTLECNLETISWVEVSIQGELLQDYKAKYERLVRLRLRNDLSMIKHETLGYLDALKKYEWDTESPEMKKRGHVTCLVWTVGDDFPVAQFVECELLGYGDYSLRPSFQYSTLGYSNSSSADEQVRDAIRDIIAEISSMFLEARDASNQ